MSTGMRTLTKFIDRTGWFRDAGRFLVAGLANAGLTLCVYQGLLFLMPHQPAYTGAWMCGLLFVMVVYPKRVFPDGRRRWSATAMLGLSYVIVFAIGLVVLEALTQVGMVPRLAIVFVMAATTVSNFVLARTIFRRPNAVR